MTLRLARGPACDTIFAPATAAGRSAVTVIRLSGSATAQTIGHLAGALPKPRVASLRKLKSASGEVLDHALVLWFPGPHSYTGEDCAELHLHGGRAILQATISTLLEAGLRPADPGEFTFRAHQNGKLDLLRAEAIGHLADAETDAERILALRQLSGEQSAIMARWSTQLTGALAWQEALIDFADEALPAETSAQLDMQLHTLIAEMSDHLAGIGRVERLRRGLLFVIAGEPNVGKSSLLNAIVGHQAAIVSDRPGTTRDPVSVDLILDGIGVTLVDTAGLRESQDPVEAEGIRRTCKRMEDADLVIQVIEAGPYAAMLESGLCVANKCDLAVSPTGVLSVSALTGEGVPVLVKQLTAAAHRLANPGGAVLTNARHAAALRDAIDALGAASLQSHAELRAEELRSALNAVGRIAGTVPTERLLDVVFSSFCIGK